MYRMNFDSWLRKVEDDGYELLSLKFKTKGLNKTLYIIIDSFFDPIEVGIVDDRNLSSIKVFPINDEINNDDED